MPERTTKPAPGTRAPRSATRRTGMRSAKCPIAMPPTPVAIVATEYAAETSARGQANSAASGSRNTATVPIAPKAMKTIAVQTATMRKFMAAVSPRGALARLRPRSRDCGKNCPGLAGLLSQAAVAREHDRLGAALDLDLVEDMRDVVAHRLLGQRKARGDLRVVEPLRHQLEHLALARGELREARRLRRAPRRIELDDRLEQLVPRRVAARRDVVAALQADEARARNQA